jgi:MFS family permease
MTSSLKSFDWKFWSFLGIMTIFAVGNSSDVFLILRAQNAGIPAVMIPVVYLFYNLVYSLSSLPAGMAADRFGKKRVVFAGFLLFSLVYFGFAVSSSAKAMWGLFGLYGLFMGMTEGIQKAFLATIIPEDFKATAFGIYNTAIGLALFPASLIGGWLWDNVSPSATFYYGAATAFLSSVLFFIYSMVVRRDAAERTALK